MVSLLLIRFSLLTKFLSKRGGIIMDLHNFKFSIIFEGQGSQLIFIRDHSKAADETLITNTAIQITSS